MKRPTRKAALRGALEFIAAHPDGCTEAILAAEIIPASFKNRGPSRLALRDSRDHGAGDAAGDRRSGLAFIRGTVEYFSPAAAREEV